MDRGIAELITILEHIKEIHSKIYTTEMLRSHVYEELEKLRVEAEGGEARTITGCLVDIILAVFCFWVFGPWIGLVATFIAIAIVYSVENKIRKIRNIGRGSEIKKFKQEYETKKEPMEKDMERYSTKIHELEKDLIYRYYKYVFEWTDGRHDITVGTTIDMLQNGNADTIETALRCQGVSINNIEAYKNATLSRGEPEIIEKYLEEAEKGNIRAQLFRGNICYKVEDKYEALHWYLKAANQEPSSESAIAQIKCGDMYCNGEGTQTDKHEALNWYLKAAQFGNSNAKLKCGEMYYNGEGTPVNKHEALNWYLKAAQYGGNKKAELKCGDMYYNGEGTNEDKQEALKWYLQAAKDGECVAQFICGKMYYNGEGTKKDKQEALKWFLKAAEQGHREAKLLYDKYSD